MSKVKKIIPTRVERSNEIRKIIIPEGMLIDDAIAALHRQRDYENTVISITEELEGFFVLDAAFAFYKSLVDTFGLVHQEAIQTFFGSKPPQMIQIPLPDGTTVQVPWGRISLRMFGDGWVQTSMTEKSEGMSFLLTANVQRKYAEHIKGIAKRTKEYLKDDSIYRGKAIEVKFRDEQEKLMPWSEVRFMNVSDIKERDIILNVDTKLMIDTNLLAPIKYRDVCMKMGISPKRGVLLSGTYGVGKSMTAKLTAKISSESGYTFLYVRSPKELFEALRVAECYAPAIVFCEDIDVVLTDERSVEINKILNRLQGIETQKLDVITVLTTNHIDRIGPAFLRPGRLDSVIEIDLPNEDAAMRLIRLYGGQSIEEGEDLSEVARELAGTIPSIIQSVVEKAKLYQIYLSEGQPTDMLSSASLLASAKQMSNQIQLLKAASSKKVEKKERYLVISEEKVPLFTTETNHNSELALEDK